MSSGTVIAWGRKNVGGQRFADSTFNGVTGIEDMDLRIVLTFKGDTGRDDLYPHYYDIAWFAKTKYESEFTEIHSDTKDLPVIAGVGFGVENGNSAVSTDGTIGSFSLVTVPELSSYAFIAGLLALFIIMMRRRP